MNYILVFYIVIELAFAAYCLQAKDNHSKVQIGLRIGSFLLFAALTLASVIKWSFRWYFAAAFLFAMAIIGVYRHFRENRKIKPFKIGYVIRRAIVMVVMLILVFLPSVIFPQYQQPKTTGQYQVATVEYTYTDTSRFETFTDTGEYRKVTVEFWYPEGGADGTYPLVVFSHGAFGIKASNTSTFKELASNGYVVCSIDHPYHAAYTVDTDGNLTLGSQAFINEIVNANKGVYNEEEKLVLMNKWLSVRTGDINFVLNTIVDSTSDGGVYALVDTTRIGLIGHSMGGAASVEVGRMRNDIDAVVNLDGEMFGEYIGIQNGKMVISDEPYPLPMLNFYSDFVLQELKKYPDSVYPNQYISSISPAAFEVCVKGSGHMSYTDLPLFSPFLSYQLSGISGESSDGAKVDKYYCIETMNDLVLRFFNRYLKNGAEFTAEEYYYHFK